MATTSTFLHTGAPSITLATCWHPSTRHVELILTSLGLLKSSNAVSTPGTRHTDDQVERRNGEAQQYPAMTTVFQSCVVRASFLSQDRADLGEAAKGLAQQMSTPSTSSMEHIKRLGTLLAWRVMTVFDVRAAENASQHLCLS